MLSDRSVAGRSAAECCKLARALSHQLEYAALEFAVAAADVDLLTGGPLLAVPPVDAVDAGC